MSKFLKTFDFIRSQFSNKDEIYLHEPVFRGNEKKYLLDCIDSTFVSSIGKYVNRFEIDLARKIGTEKAVAFVNGTSALHIALKLIGVKDGDEVITQALTFIATANAISYNKAFPIFLDVDLDTMGLSPKSLEEFLTDFGEIRDDGCYNKKTKKRISACLPMHTFGFPVRISEILKICKKWKIPVVEDAAESLGSSSNGKAIGSFGDIGVFSFNGNKIVTTGGGGAITTNNNKLAVKAKHLSTVAKVPHPYKFIHDMIGYNYRMPNINAAIGCAQLENLNQYLLNKRMLAKEYEVFFKSQGIIFRTEMKNTITNYWLMCIELESEKEKELFLKKSVEKKISMRPIWELINTLPFYARCQTDSLKNAIFLKNRILNIPSGVRE